MKPRYDRILTGLMFAATAVLCVWLIVIAVRARHAQHTALESPPDLQPVTLVLPDDSTGTLRRADASLPPATTPGARAKALVDLFAAKCAEPGATHPLHPGPAAVDVFLMPSRKAPTLIATESPTSEAAPVVAIVNLTHAFVARHPSGIEVENLTLRGIAATLHENMSEVKQVRFLVDGQPSDTLAGHADMTRVYSTVRDADDPLTENIQ